MSIAYLSLGSNEGAREKWLRLAVLLIAEHCGKLMRQSAVYETAAWGITDQAPFLNQAMQLDTCVPPGELLAALLGIETALGRHRSVKWGPRIIDIDILLYNNDIVQAPGLAIPHPFLQDRRFTLVPLAELAPAYVHPVLHKTIAELLETCPDMLEVRKV